MSPVFRFWDQVLGVMEGYASRGVKGHGSFCSRNEVPWAIDEASSQYVEVIYEEGAQQPFYCAIVVVITDKPPAAGTEESHNDSQSIWTAPFKGIIRDYSNNKRETWSYSSFCQLQLTMTMFTWPRGTTCRHTTHPDFGCIWLWQMGLWRSCPINLHCWSRCSFLWPVCYLCYYCKGRMSEKQIASCQSCYQYCTAPAKKNTNIVTLLM